MEILELQKGAVNLLMKLISTPSFSTQEDQTAQLISAFLDQNKVSNINRNGNNIWAVNRFFDPNKRSILLNSHHDTVRPNKGYTRDPFSPDVEGDLLYGLGSNDAGASAVSLLACFLWFYNLPNLKYNIAIAITAEEENSGDGGLSSILDLIPTFEFALVGEPTQMQMAIAERGLMVLDCTAVGKAGHAAREEGINAISQAIKDIEWFHNYQFQEVSELLGRVKMTVTQINAGAQHNVIPATCDFVVDVRSTDKYSNQDILDIIEKNVNCLVKPRNKRLNPSFIDKNHEIVLSGTKLGLSSYGSPTLSDQAFISQPSLKIGPGDSARSHSADEYIKISEIYAGIETYIELLSGILI